MTHCTEDISLELLINLSKEDIAGHRKEFEEKSSIYWECDQNDFTNARDLAQQVSEVSALLACATSGEEHKEWRGATLMWADMSLFHEVQAEES